MTHSSPWSGVLHASSSPWRVPSCGRHHGELYMGVMGLLSLLAIDDRPDLGLVRFSPLASSESMALG